MGGSCRDALEVYHKEDFVRNATPSINLMLAFFAKAEADRVNVELVITHPSSTP